MRKNLKAKAYVYPLPVLIVGTYDEKGKIDLTKFQPLCYDCCGHGYFKLGERVGNAFSDGLQLK